MRRALLLWTVSLLSACGSAPPKPEPPPAPPPNAQPASSPSRSEEIQVEGLMGTIAPHAVEQAMNLRLQRLSECFLHRSETLDVIGGRMVLAFRIGRSGDVRWVYPRQSTVGDRETERCVLEVARRTRFPRPQGGEAEANWSFEMEPAEDVRPPVSLHASQFEAQAVERSAEIRARCGAGPFEVTVYVLPGGSVQSAGAAASSPEDAERIDCVVERVLTWDDWPDPGSYIGKGTFRIP